MSRPSFSAILRPPVALPMPKVDELEDLRIPRTRAKPAGAGPRRRNPWPARIAALAALGAAIWLFWPMMRSFADSIRLPVVRVAVLREQSPAAAAAVRGTAANGHVVAARRAALSSDVPGRIVEMNVEEGSIVHRGDIVARLFSEEYRAALDRAKADVEASRAGVEKAKASLEAAKVAAKQMADTEAATSAQRAEAEVLRDFAKAEHARVEDLLAKGVASDKDLEKATSDLDAAEARVRSLLAQERAASSAKDAAEARVLVASSELDQARALERVSAALAAQANAALDKTDVRAPFDGVVVLKDAEIGEVVSPNVQGGSTARGAVCTLVDFDSLEVQVTVPEQSLAAVRLGAEADIFLDARPDHAYPGRVDRIWPTADRQKATVEVRVAFLEKDEFLRPEMGVRVVFRQQDVAKEAPRAEPVLLVPEDALVQLGGRRGVFVLERDVVRFAPLKLGASRQGRVVVESGVASGSTVVLDPPASLGDGDRVRIAESQ
ncbi:MAG: efflux RND transporter periplasmic adaptor subunit [Planctomycetota bacterium]